jgi:hypothetical protein
VSGSWKLFSEPDKLYDHPVRLPDVVSFICQNPNSMRAPVLLAPGVAIRLPQLLTGQNRTLQDTRNEVI